MSKSNYFTSIKELYLVFLLAFFCSPIYAENVESSCRNGLFPSEGKQVQLYRVTSEQPANFFKDEIGCPEAAKCKEKAYIVKGDEVLVSKIKNGWACAWYQGKKYESVGWINANKIQQSLDPLPKAGDWLGKWKGGAGWIKIEKSNGSKPHVTGFTTWGTGLRTHTGEINGFLQQNGRYALTKEGDDEYSCIVEFTRVGRYLIVSDNGNCGGMNVRFDDVYVRK